jgi:hypothetical protein
VLNRVCVFRQKFKSTQTPKTLTHFLSQNYPVSVNIFKTLEAAKLYRAEALKKACFSVIFTFGQQFLVDATQDMISHELALEMLRDFAARRTEHMPNMLTPNLKVMPSHASLWDTQEGGEPTVKGKKRKAHDTKPPGA